MKKLILASLLLFVTAAFGEVKLLTWSGNNPAGSVAYVVEVNRTNPNDDTKWTSLVLTMEENFQYDESNFGRTYYRVWAETLEPDPETGEPIRSASPSNVVSTVIRPNAPAGLTEG